MTIRAVLCDDHTLVRAAIRSLLENEAGIDVVGEAASADDAVEQVRELEPDVLILDLTMPERSGVTVIPDLRAASPSTRILILSMQDDPRYIRQALDAGADGYLLKKVADHELVHAIRDVVEGRRHLQPSLAARLPAQTELAPRRRRETLPVGEDEVLQLLARGYTNPEIAEILSFSLGTVGACRARIMEKLQLSTRAELVRYVLESGEPPIEALAQTT